MLRLPPGPSAGTRRNLQHSRGHAWTLCLRSRCGLRHETRRPGHHHGTQRADCFAIQARLIFLPLAETPHRRHLIASSRVTEMKLGNGGTRAFTIALLFGRRTDDRTRPSRERLSTHQTTASGRNGQQMSAKSLHRRWMHEIQIVLLRRRAAMARAVLPSPSARAEWLFAGIIGRACLHHWRQSPSSRRRTW